MKGNGSALTIGIFPRARWDRCGGLSLLAETAGAGASPGSGRFSFPGRLPVPGQQRLKLVLSGPSGDNSFKHVGQPGQRFDAIQFCRLHERRNDRPMTPTVIVSREKRVLPYYRYGPDGTLDSVGMCALPRCTALPGGNPGRQTLAPAGSTRGGSGGDEWPEALREKTPSGGQRTVRAAT